MSTISRFGALVGAFCVLGMSACHSNLDVARTSTAEATPSIPGTVKAVVGGRQTLAVPFTASESSPITNLKVTSGLVSLPAGWTGPGTFSCDSVSTGNGCTLDLVFQPTGVTGGTLVIDYSYTDSSGKARTGSLSLPYASTSHNNVQATVSPTGQVAVMAAGGSRTVTVTFDTDDGNSATALAVSSNLASLPAGWSTTAHALSCASVGTGNGCQLVLGFAPATAMSGNLALDFSYTDNSGTAKTGSVSIPYGTTSNDNVVAAASPGGQVSTVVGGTQAITLTFTTDDGKPASSLTVAAAALTALPSDWTSRSSSLTCASVSTGNGCQLHLTYAPTALGAGSVHLSYRYTDNAGTAKTGTASISYAATTHDNITASVSPGAAVAPYVGRTKSVTVTFTTDDGNPASLLSVTSGLGSLPAEWSGAGSFTCSTVASGTGCRLTLTYAPTAVTAASNVALSYSYQDDSGAAKTGSVTIPFSSNWAPHIYIGDSHGLWNCALANDDTLSSCVTNGSFNGTTGLSFNGEFAYVSDFNSSQVSVCAVATDGTGTLSGCIATGSGFNSPVQSAAHAGYLYVPDANGGTHMTVCAINGTNGTLSSCTATGGGLGSGPSSVVFNGNFAYVNNWSGNAALCTLTGADLNSCNTTGGSLPGGWSVTPVGDYAYLALNDPASLGTCTIASDGTFTGCSTTTIGGTGPGDGARLKQIAIVGDKAYIASYYLDMNTSQEYDHVYVCSVSGTTVSNCVQSDGGVTLNNPWAIAAH